MNELAKKTWARLSWGARMTQWLRGDPRRNFKEKAAYKGNPHKTAYWLATSNSSVCVCAVTLSQMGFVNLTNTNLRFTSPESRG